MLSSASPAIQKTIPSNIRPSTYEGCINIQYGDLYSKGWTAKQPYHEVVWNQGIDEPYGRQWECFPWFQIIWDYAVYMRHKL